MWNNDYVNIVVTQEICVAFWLFIIGAKKREKEELDHHKINVKIIFNAPLAIFKI